MMIYVFVDADEPVRCGLVAPIPTYRQKMCSISFYYYYRIYYHCLTFDKLSHSTILEHSTLCNNSTTGLNFVRDISSLIINHKVCNRTRRYLNDAVTFLFQCLFVVNCSFPLHQQTHIVSRYILKF